MYTPDFEGPIMGYVVNDLKANHWKIARTVPHSDAMQEAYCVFLKCKRTYADTVTEPAHFMALFKTAWYRRFTDMANEDTERRCECAIPVSAVTGEEIQQEGESDNDGMLAVMIRQAPREVQMVLSLFLNAPQELLDIALGSWKAQGDRRCRAGGSLQVNRLLGLPEDQDTMQHVVDYFRP